MNKLLLAAVAWFTMTSGLWAQTGTLRREPVTTSAFTRRALTNETAAQFRAWIGTDTNGNSISYDLTTSTNLPFTGLDSAARAMITNIAQTSAGTGYVTTNETRPTTITTLTSTSIGAGTVTASGGLAGPGSGVTALNADNIASGTVALARIPSAVVTNGQSRVGIDIEGITIAGTSDQSFITNAGNPTISLIWNEEPSEFVFGSGVRAPYFQGDGQYITNIINLTPEIATNNATASDGDFLSKTGNRLKLISASGIGDVIAANNASEFPNKSLVRTNLGTYLGESITAGTVADARIASTITRDSELATNIAVMANTVTPLSLNTNFTAKTGFWIMSPTNGSETAFIQTDDGWLTITPDSGIYVAGDQFTFNARSITNVHGTNIIEGTIPNMVTNRQGIVAFGTNYTDRVEATNLSSLVLAGGGLEVRLGAASGKVTLAGGSVDGLDLSAISGSNFIKAASIRTNEMDPVAYAAFIGGGSTYSNITESGYTTSVQSNLVVNAGAANTLVVTNGRVGIGTGSPTQTLSVSGGNIQLDNNYSLRSKSAGGTEFNLLNVNSADNITLGGVSGSDFFISSGSSFVVKSTGAVGIGFAAPAASLHVTNKVGSVHPFRVSATGVTNAFNVDDAGLVTAAKTITATNGFLVPTNYTAANFAPVAGKGSILASNNVPYWVTQTTTNAMLSDGAGSGSQTPWTSDIDAATNSLVGVAAIRGRNLSSLTLSSQDEDASIILYNYDQAAVTGVSAAYRGSFKHKFFDAVEFAGTNTFTGPINSSAASTFESDLTVNGTLFTASNYITDLTAENFEVVNPWDGAMVTNIISTNIVYAVLDMGSTNYTVTSNCESYYGSGTNQIVTLPAAASTPAGRWFNIGLNGTAYASIIVTNANGADTILTAGGLSQTITNGQSLVIQCTGNSWR